MEISKVDFSGLLKELTDIGVALSVEKDHSRLLEMILIKAMEVTNADGGSLYTHTEDKCLKFEIMLTDSLGVHKGGTSEDDIEFSPISLYSDDGKPNDHMVAAWAAINGETVNVEDAYTSEQFDFSGTRNFDEKTGYRSMSFLTVPMNNHENELIGVLQLINAEDEESGEVVPFSSFDQQVVESLSSQAAVTITNRSLIDAQKQLFDALIQLIAFAIDEKSPYTAGHCRRVPLLTNMLADAACSMDIGPLKDFQMTDIEKYELEVAAWLHDCGKITTPEYVVDKSTKLETIFDRIHLIEARFEILKRDAEIQALRRQLESSDGKTQGLDEDKIFQQRLSWIDNARNFIALCNIGGETIKDEDIREIDVIATEIVSTKSGEALPLLTEEETQNLKIGRGTLSIREREIINNHVSVTIKMLESLPYPQHLRRVPEYAGGHHEKIDGSGYPNKLKGEEMSLQARMLAIADVFEALTASDRPYKDAMPLSQSLSILGQMKLDGHIDPDLFNIFIHDQIYLRYAEEHLDEKQIDEVDLAKIPGYQSLH